MGEQHGGSGLSTEQLNRGDAHSDSLEQK